LNPAQKQKLAANFRSDSYVGDIYRVVEEILTEQRQSFVDMVDQVLLETVEGDFDANPVKELLGRLRGKR
jgi:hypothetical protein